MPTVPVSFYVRRHIGDFIHREVLLISYLDPYARSIDILFIGLDEARCEAA